MAVAWFEEFSHCGAHGVDLICGSEQLSAQAAAEHTRTHRPLRTSKTATASITSLSSSHKVPDRSGVLASNFLVHRVLGSFGLPRGCGAAGILPCRGECSSSRSHRRWCGAAQACPYRRSVCVVLTEVVSAQSDSDHGSISAPRAVLASPDPSRPRAQTGRESHKPCAGQFPRRLAQIRTRRRPALLRKPRCGARKNWPLTYSLGRLSNRPTNRRS